MMTKYIMFIMRWIYIYIYIYGKFHQENVWREKNKHKHCGQISIDANAQHNILMFGSTHFEQSIYIYVFWISISELANANCIR